MEMRSDGISNPLRVVEIYFMSQEYELVQVCSSFVAVFYFGNL